MLANSRNTVSVSAAVEDEHHERVVFASPIAGIGALRCPPDSLYFRGEHFTNNYVVAFPRSSFWIRQDRGRAFVASPTIVTMYNKAQFHERRPIGFMNGSTDWFAVSEDFARSAVRAFDPHAADASEPFAFTNAPSSPKLYREQREVFELAERRTASASYLEERVIHLIDHILSSAYGQPVDAHPGRSDRARRELVERAKEVIVSTCLEELNVQDIARRVGCSVFHLCRTFRLLTGQTLHGFRRDIRLRMALGMLNDRRRDYSALALELGFSSHSHFTNAFREQFGVTPSRMSAS